VGRRAEPEESVGSKPYIECVFENDLVELGATETLAAAEGRCHVVCVNTPMEVSSDDGCCGIRTWDAGASGLGPDQPVTAREAVDKMVQSGMLDDLMNQVDSGDLQSDNPNPAPGYGEHPTAASIWSTPPAPTPSATPNSPKQSGVSRRARQSETS
jgi:hypothetical protein